MNLDLSDEKAAPLTADTTGNDRYPFSERICTLKAILATLGPAPVREPPAAANAYGPRKQQPAEGDGAGEIRTANTPASREEMMADPCEICGNPAGYREYRG